MIVFSPWELKSYWGGRGQVRHRANFSSYSHESRQEIHSLFSHLTLNRNKSWYSWLLWTADMIFKIKPVLPFCIEELPSSHFGIKSIKKKKLLQLNRLQSQSKEHCSWCSSSWWNSDLGGEKSWYSASVSGDRRSSPSPATHMDAVLLDPADNTHSWSIFRYHYRQRRHACQPPLVFPISCKHHRVPHV